MVERDESFEKLLAAQHRRLDALFAELVGALRSDDPAEDVRDAFARLREALETHVDQEDRLYYPAVRAIRPVHRAVLEGLVGAHETFRAQLGEIAARLAVRARAEAERAVVDFVAGFAAHEADEERLLRRLDAEIQGALEAGPR